MKVVYIAGKFRGKTAWDVAENVRAAERIGFDVARAGAMPLIPHANTAHFDGTMTGEFWLEGTMELMRRCDAVMMVPGWRGSQGAMAEFLHANEMQLPVFEPNAQFDDFAAFEKWLATPSPETGTAAGPTCNCRGTLPLDKGTHTGECCVTPNDTRTAAVLADMDWGRHSPGPAPEPMPCLPPGCDERGVFRCEAHSARPAPAPVKPQGCPTVWCGAPYAGAGSAGPGMDARLGIDYVRGWDFEYYCSTGCRDKKVPRLAGYPADYNRSYIGPWRPEWNIVAPEKAGGPVAATAEPVKPPATCQECGHRHQGPQLGGICIGCTCARTPSAGTAPKAMSGCELVDCDRPETHTHRRRCEHPNPGDGSCDNCQQASAK